MAMEEDTKTVRKGRGDRATSPLARFARRLLDRLIGAHDRDDRNQPPPNRYRAGARRPAPISAREAVWRSWGFGDAPCPSPQSATSVQEDELARELVGVRQVGVAPAKLARERPCPPPRVNTPWHKAERVRERLRKALLGQGRAIDAVQAYLLANTHLLTNGASRRGGCRCPLFVFLGRPACGKLYAAKQLAAALDMDYLSLDCGHVKTRIERAMFRGDQATISGSGPGIMTSQVERYPATLVCLENFDCMMNEVGLFLDEILTEGCCTDLFTGRSVDFTRAAIVLHCSSAVPEFHHREKLERLHREGPGQVRAALVEALAQAKHQVHDGVEAVFAPAIMAAIRDHACICVFEELLWEDLNVLARRGFDKALKRCADLFGCPPPTLSEEAATAAARILLMERGGDAGAGTVAGFEAQLMTALAPALRGATRTPARLLVEVPAAASLAVILEGLGEQPLHAMRRALQRLDCPVAAGWSGERGEDLALVLAGPARLVKQVNALDFDAGLQIELPDTRFKQVVGHAEVKEVLRRDLDRLNRWRELRGRGYEPPSGLLLYGPPGVGKTLLARAAAGEAALPFVAVTGHELLELKRQTEVFRIARRYAASILFVDEIDGLGKRGTSANEPAVTALLSHLDGFAKNPESPPVYLLATTNNIQNVDDALLRAGRIERSIKVEMPPRHRFFADEARRLPRDAWRALVAATYSMNGADLMAIKREIALSEAGDRKAVLDIVFACRYGSKPERITDAEKRSGCLHEAGHAVCAAALGMKVRYAALICRGDRVGTVNRDPVLGDGPRRAVADIAVALAGTLAEQLEGRRSGRGLHTAAYDAGAANDLKKANQAAEIAITELGYDKRLGFRCDTGGKRPFLPAALVHERARVWLNNAARLAVKTLRRNWPAVQAAAEVLYRDGWLDGKEIRAIVANTVPPNTHNSCFQEKGPPIAEAGSEAV